MKVNGLESLGWSPFFERQLAREDDAATAARVVEEQRGSYRLLDGSGREWFAAAGGRLSHERAAPAERPVVGDWVLARFPDGGPERGTAVIRRVLTRRSAFSRKDPGRRSEEQVIAANADTVFLAQSLNQNLNPRRLERFLALLWESGAVPVVLLTKADLCPDPAPAVAEMEASAPGVAVLAVSALESGGLRAIEPYLAPGRTVAVVGSSGVGKSTLVNRLAGREVQPVREIRDDDRGRHTTSARRLVVLPGGAMILDTPGMRTALMWEGEEGLGRVFEDVEGLAGGCRFRDCRHDTEPGCAVRRAVRAGELSEDRLAAYRKLEREIRHQAARTDVHLRQAERKRWRRIHLEARRRPDKRKP
jgi:ribosome biogenesis GTPase